MNEDRRLIEDYLPIEAISAEASREKSVRKGHISTLHLWWARRPLVACRAAVYGALVPADRWVREVQLKNPPDDPTKAEAVKNGKKLGLNRKAASDFMKRLCRYPSDSKPAEKADIERAIKEAQRHILEAHAERLSVEIAEWKSSKTDKPAWIDEFKFAGKRVTANDIAEGRAPRPRVLDMFAGGGAIPLEALRLGCEAYANDLNPVAHIIELCTLVYPQKYGKPDPTVRGMTGPKEKDGSTTWGGLADEVRYWGNWVLKKVKGEIGDLYPPIPDPEFKGTRPPIEFDKESGEWIVSRKGARKRKGEDDPFAPPQPVMEFAEDAQMRLSPSAIDHEPSTIPPGYLMPVAYLWTRTVKCKNPACGATVPLVKQTWLCKNDGHYIAMKMVAPKGKKLVRFEVVEALTANDLGFDPEAFSKGGNATCPFCGTVADSDHVQSEGCAKRVDQQLMAVVCVRSGSTGKVYLAADDGLAEALDVDYAKQRIKALNVDKGSRPLDEKISPLRPSPNARGLSAVTRHGITTFGDLFSSRQMLCLLSFAAAAREATDRIANQCSVAEAQGIAAYMGVLVDRLADYNSSLCHWHNTGEKISNTFGRQALPMVWDFCELAPFGGGSGSPNGALDWIVGVAEAQVGTGLPCNVVRGSATSLPWPDLSLDAIVTDPPYYDNVPYADISDFFYVWLKRSVGHLYREHFSAELTPKKTEATALSSRHNGDMGAAEREYERFMSESFSEAHRVLKPGGQLTVVYAHKTTLGWSTLVDALRKAGFIVTEAWPLDTEMKARLLAMNSAALASSIFLVARKRDTASKAGNYESDVVSELADIVRERVETLWDMGISGADLVIACVGAGLRAFTKYPRVEFANGEEVPAERFLAEVEAVVLETILGKLSNVARTVARASRPCDAANGRHGQDAHATLSSLDPATRFYVLWRYTYGGAELDAGEAIIFANGTHVELEGSHGLSTGHLALIEKKKGKYRLLDFTERGEYCGGTGGGKDGGTGVPPVSHVRHGQDARATTGHATIDALHRLLWLVEHKPPMIPAFLEEAKPNIEQLRLVAQALAGPALKGGDMADVSSSAEQSTLGKLLANWNAVVVGKAAAEDKKAGQDQLF